MSYTEWAFDTALAVPAQLVSRDDREIDALVAASHSRSIYTKGSAASLNPLFVFPVTRSGGAPDQWFVRDPANDTPAYVAGDGGQLYEITEAFREMTINEAKARARDDLEDYYQAYSTSQFSAAGADFGAAPAQTITYLIIDTIIAKAEAAGGYSGGQIVFDLAGDGHPVQAAANWNGFWNQYENLFDEARSVAGTAIQDVKAATTTDEVRIIIAALPAIPGA
jgi:hypothetical protein